MTPSRFRSAETSRFWNPRGPWIANSSAPEDANWSRPAKNGILRRLYLQSGKRVHDDKGLSGTWVV